VITMTCSFTRFSCTPMIPPPDAMSMLAFRGG
jgi:hypothetical protein